MPVPRPGQLEASRAITSTARLEKIHHVIGGSASARVASHTQSLHSQPQQVLVLREVGILVSRLNPGTDHHCSDVPAAVAGVGAVAFVKQDNQQSVVLKS